MRRRARVACGLAAAGTPTVLVLDDDASSLKIAEATLRDMGCRPVCTATAEEALRIAALDPPAIAVIDLLMPDIDGFEFVSRFRQTAAGRNVPIIAWTIKDLNSNEQRRLRLLATAVASKTGRGAPLSDVLNRILSEGPRGTKDAHGG